MIQNMSTVKFKAFFGSLDQESLIDLQHREPFKQILQQGVPNVDQQE